MRGIKGKIKDHKGFTLVEIIVVLVILAILAAFTIPAMLGFVSDAKGKALIPEAREVYVAAQSAATEYSATTTITDTGDDTWEGLTNSLGSTRISVRSKYPADHWGINLPRVQVSLKMLAYLSPDIKISSADLIANANAKPTGDEAAWTVTVGADPANLKTGKVTKVVYLKNGYQVTIEDDNASVSKW